MNYAARVPIRNYLTGKEYYLCRADSIEYSDSLRDQIVATCNQPAIYDSLFKELFKGEPYASEAAFEFTERARAGWLSNTYFVFFIVSGDDMLAGCLDIKTADLDEAEIGYWASIDHPGNMTNAVATLLRLSAEAGFRRFVAYARNVNEKSSRVLMRTGFSPTTEIKQVPGCRSYAT